MEPDNRKSLIFDIVFGCLGYGILLSIDPLTATFFGAPLLFSTLLVRRRWWPGSPAVGGVVMMIASMTVSLGLAYLFFLGSMALFLGVLPAASTIALVELFARQKKRNFIRRFALTTGLLFIATTVLYTGILLESGIVSYPTEDLIKKISEAPSAPKWGDQSKTEAVAAVRSVLDFGIKDKEAPAGLYSKISQKAAALKNEPSRFGVYVTLYDEYGYRSFGESQSGRDSLEKIIEATINAVAKKPQKPRSLAKKKAPWAAASERTRVQIDVAGPKTRMAIRPVFYLLKGLIRLADKSLKELNPLGELLNIAFQTEVGIDGLVIRDALSGLESTVLPSDPITYGWLTPRVISAPKTIETIINRAGKRDFSQTADFISGDLQIVKFRTSSFGNLSPKDPVIDWLRGNALLREGLSRCELVKGTIAAADWLSRQVKPGGKFAYEKFPPFKNETDSYNLPRHAGAIYGLFAFHKASLKEEAFKKSGLQALKAGLEAFEYVKQNLGSPESSADPDHLCFLDGKKRADSGSTALAAMAITEMAELFKISEIDLQEKAANIPINKWLNGMGLCMLKMIDEEGAVFRSYGESLKKKHVVQEPLYYPGEVMLALSKMYQRTHDRKLLEGAKKIGDRQLRIFKWAISLGFPVPGDHWIIQALYELAVITGNRDYAELSVLLGRGYLREQHPRQLYLYPDYLGAYRRVGDIPRTTRAGSRGEALGGAMNAAVFLKEDSKEFKLALILGARHLLEQQFTSSNSYFIPQSFDVIGGIRMGLVDNHLRIDNNQHSLVALLRALEAMDSSL